MINIADQCSNRWRSILPMFGIGTEYLTGKHGPCPICEGTDRFRFDDKDGRGTFFCTNCRPGDGLRLLMLKTGQGFNDVAQSIRERLGETKTSPAPKKTDPAASRRYASGLWGQSVPLVNDDAAQYLSSRGLRGPYPNALRYCPSAKLTDVAGITSLPAMVALVTAPDGESATLQRTYLQGPRKAQIPEPRKLMGPLPPGSAIRLGNHDGRLGVAEGIETALAVKQLFGITCWSLINSDNLSKFVPPDDVRELHIFGDNDTKFGGQAFSWMLAHRIACRPNPPLVFPPRYPDQPGTDWADFPETEGVA